MITTKKYAVETSNVAPVCYKVYTRDYFDSIEDAYKRFNELAEEFDKGMWLVTTSLCLFEVMDNGMWVSIDGKN